MNNEHFLQGPSGLDLELVEVLQGPRRFDLEGGFDEEWRELSWSFEICLGALEFQSFKVFGVMWIGFENEWNGFLFIEFQNLIFWI